MSTASIQLKHTQVSPTSIGTRQCITTKQQVAAICSIGSYSTTLFSATLALATGGQCGYQIDAKIWSRSTAGLDRGARWEARPEGSTVESTKGSMEGSAGGGREFTEGARYVSTCSAMMPPVIVTYPRDSHVFRLGNHGQRSCGSVRTSVQARPHCVRTYGRWQQIGEGIPRLSFGRDCHTKKLLSSSSTTRSSSVGNFTTLVESSGQVEFWVRLILVRVCFCVWFPLGVLVLPVFSLFRAFCVCSVSFSVFFICCVRFDVYM